MGNQRRGMRELRRESRTHSLRRRWMTNSMAIIFLVVMVAAGSFTMAMASAYYSTMQEGLEKSALTATRFLNKYTEQDYLSAARTYMTSDFSDRSAIELQFLTPTGRVLMSSLLDVSGTVPGTLDIQGAVSGKNMQSWEGNNPHTGEHIMAVSAPVIYNDAVVGVVRLVTSLERADRQVLHIMLITLGIALFILTVVWVINLYFIRSVLDPVHRVTETAKRIAAGSYGIQMEKRSDDEMGQLTDAINDMSLKIDQAERTQSEFISSVSHELRTPLTAINGWAETLYRGEAGNLEDMKKGMGIIVSEARRLTNMVEELLEFSRIEAGQFTLSVEQMDIKAELEDAVYTYREFFRRKGLEMGYQDCEEEFPPLMGDPGRLRQVFCNLLDNADKHGGSGGRVDVSIDGEADWVIIRIRDYGPGIPVEELPHVKYRFYKGSSKARGSGIGLAVCEEIITRHDGTLELDNAPGGGCIVTIRLPLATV